MSLVNEAWSLLKDFSLVFGEAKEIQSVSPRQVRHERHPPNSVRSSPLFRLLRYIEACPILRDETDCPILKDETDSPILRDETESVIEPQLPPRYCNP